MSYRGERGPSLPRLRKGRLQGIIEGMQPVQVLDAVVTVFGVSMGASTLLQARRIIKRGRSDDVSVGMLLILIAGSILWLAYGFTHDLTAVIATNATWLVGASLALAVTLRYRRAPRAGPSDAADRVVRAAQTPGRRPAEPGR